MKSRLRGLRQFIAAFMLIAATALFLDFTGSIHALLGWVAKVQIVPAILALNLVVVIVLLLLTLLMGRLYCSTICPLGVTQDVISRFASLVNKKHKYTYSKGVTWLRWSAAALFVVGVAAGIGSIVTLLEPYSAFGRIVSTLFAPIYKLGNNLLALIAERMDSYLFYTTEVVVMSVGALLIAILTLVIIGYLALRYGRTYCNTICPVGTILGFISRFSLLKIVVDNDKCNGCRKCVRSCKASCITPESREIDYSRCVVCFDCIDSCTQGAISYTLRGRTKPTPQTTVKGESGKPIDESKRNMLTISATILATTALKAEEKIVDGGWAIIEDKQIPDRKVPIVPPGSGSLRNFSKHCTGCQLCVSVCPNQVLRASTSIERFMQPEMSYERGYCRPECTKCSEVCPAGAITKIDRAEKSSIKIGHAVIIEKNCVILTDGVECGSCARHCPTNAIKMVLASDKDKYGGRKIPVVDSEQCIGCGACENLCPARPFSAIYVEGDSVHRDI